MANPHSPTHFNGFEDDTFFMESNFTQDINEKMRVPKRIKATGEYSDEDHLLSNQNGIMNSWNYSDKIDMNVPDRIVVLGQDRILGTRSAPREIVLENSILPKDPGFVRVATPPRIITLSEHHFPSASDENENETLNLSSSPPYFRATTAADTGNFMNGNSTSAQSPIETDSERRIGTISNQRKGNNNDNSFMANQSFRDGTPPIGDMMMNPSEEVLHLRRQLAKLNRRVLSIEIDNVQRQQREKIIYCLGLAYFLLKAIFWLNKN